jgi:response regulator RpfG family c-di-GMP phosphodiesterase
LIAFPKYPVSQPPDNPLSLSQESIMPLKVLDVGNCGPDHAAISRLLTSRFQAEVLQADQAADALQTIAQNPIALVLVNRKLDIDYSDGMEVIRAIKADPKGSQIPVMLVSNYPEAQQEAMAIGAIEGFGKLALQAPETVGRLERALGMASKP